MTTFNILFLFFRFFCSFFAICNFFLSFLINFCTHFPYQKCKKSSSKTRPTRRRILKEAVHAELFRDTYYHFSVYFVCVFFIVHLTLFFFEKNLKSLTLMN